MNAFPELDCFQDRYGLGNSVNHITMAQADSGLGHIRNLFSSKCARNSFCDRH